MNYLRLILVITAGLAVFLLAFRRSKRGELPPDKKTVGLFVILAIAIVTMLNFEWALILLAVAGIVGLIVIGRRRGWGSVIKQRLPHLQRAAGQFIQTNWRGMAKTYVVVATLGASTLVWYGVRGTAILVYGFCRAWYWNGMFWDWERWPSATEHPGWLLFDKIAILVICSILIGGFILWWYKKTPKFCGGVLAVLGAATLLCTALLILWHSWRWYEDLNFWKHIPVISARQHPWGVTSIQVAGLLIAGGPLVWGLSWLAQEKRKWRKTKSIRKGAKRPATRGK